MITVAFLEGALATLHQVNQVKTFQELPEFKEFLFFTERLSHEETRIKQDCND